MRIKVPFEVAVVIVLAIVAIWVLIGMGYLGRWLEGKFSRRSVRIGGAVIAVGCLVGAGLIAATYYGETDQHDAVYRGVEKFGLGEVILSAVLVGFAAMIIGWMGWRRAGGLLAVAAGGAVIAKPIALPLETFSEYSGWHTFGLTSETHLYFILSGAGLVGLGIILLVMGFAARRA